MRFTFEPGTYFIGDISYVMSQENYEIWTDEHICEPGMFYIASHPFAVGSTYCGDGDYDSSLDISFPVDAGVIGVVPKALWDKDFNINCNTYDTDEPCGLIVEVSTILTFDFDDGVFWIDYDNTSFTIDTKNENCDDDDEEDDFFFSDEDEYEDEDYETLD